MHEIEGYSFIPTLAQGVSRLSGEQLASLISYLRAHETTSLTSARVQRLLSISTTEASQLTRILNIALKTTGHTHSRSGEIASVLAGIAAERQSRADVSQAIEVVCTAPTRLGVPVRATFATTVEMVQMAREEIYLIGYVFTRGARALVEQLAVARRERGVRIIIVGNRMKTHLPALRAMWPAGISPPSIFSREANPDDEMAALHAKILICDSNTALVTSANFTHHGLHENIEIGVRIKSAAVIRLVEFIRAMIVTREVEPCEWKSRNKT